MDAAKQGLAGHNEETRLQLLPVLMAIKPNATPQCGHTVRWNLSICLVVSEAEAD